MLPPTPASLRLFWLPRSALARQHSSAGAVFVSAPSGTSMHFFVFSRIAALRAFCSSSVSLGIAEAGEQAR